MSIARTIATSHTTCFSEGQMHEIEVEVLLRNGLQKFDIIGLPQHMIREGRDRILAALARLGVELPTQKILVSLNPGSLRKEGSHFDLPILYGILKAIGIIPNKIARDFLWGELGLRGDIRPLDAAASHWLFASHLGATRMISANTREEIDTLQTFLPARIERMTHVSELNQVQGADEFVPLTEEQIDDRVKELWLNQDEPRWNALKGSKEQFEIWALALLGRHHLLISGPPGVGKSSWTFAAGQMQLPLARNLWNQTLHYRPWNRRPFEAPHHSASKVSVIGGGSGSILPGAITRANHGILFMDEFAEFSRDVLESLREPMETASIRVARRDIERALAANTQIIAALNPCRCGCTGSSWRCHCTSAQNIAYKARISGPLRERFHFDLWWQYENREAGTAFSAREVKKRLIDSLPPEKINLSKIELPKQSSARKTARKIESFVSWCRWHNVATPTQKDLLNFDHLLEHFYQGEN